MNYGGFLPCTYTACLVKAYLLQIDLLQRLFLLHASLLRKGERLKRSMAGLTGLTCGLAFYIEEDLFFNKIINLHT